METSLAEALQGTLQPDAAVIRAAQAHLQQNLHPQPTSGLSLIHIVYAGTKYPLAIRQAAAVNLSLWIQERWSPFFSKFIGFSSSPNQDVGSSGSMASRGDTDNSGNIALAPEYKSPIREALLQSCSLEDAKLRGPMMKALVNVASCDWPDEFPELLPRIRQILSSDETDSFVAMQGALSFLDDWFYSSMDETGLLSTTRDILPDLERILANAQLYSATIRAKCISIFNQMLETLWMVKEQYPDASKAVSAEVIPRWLDTLQVLVASDWTSTDSASSFTMKMGQHFELQARAWTAISTATHFPSQIKTRMPALLNTALASLSALQMPFQAYHLSQSQQAIETTNDSESSRTPSSLAGKVVDFIGIALQHSLPKSTNGEEVLRRLLPLFCFFSRITMEEQEEWLENVSAFVAASDEDDLGALNGSMRARCADILGELILVKERETFEAFKSAVATSHEQGIESKSRGDEDWWKAEESSLALIGGIADHIVEKIEEARGAGRSAPFDIEGIFTSIILPNMTPGTPFFLYGRCFVFASQFASILPEQLASIFLATAVAALEDDSNSDGEGDAIIKISAVRCIKNFHRHLSPALVGPFAGRILTRLGPLLSGASEDTLVLIVETLQAVAMQEEATGADSVIPNAVYGEIVSESIRAWGKEASDRVLQSTVEDLLEAFAAHKSAAVAITVVQRGLSLCAELLSRGQSADNDRFQSAVLVEGALEFAGAIARGASSEALRQSGAIASFCGPLFAILTSSEDREVFKNGATLLTALIAKLPDEMLLWEDSSRISSLQHILTLISNMISPSDTSESGGLAVGDLLTTILRKRPESISSTLPQLCTALTDRLATSASTSLCQSLIVPLAYLMKDHLDTVVALLSSHNVPAPEGSGGVAESSLHVLMKKWCEFASNFQGFWNNRVSSLGLCAILKNTRGSVLNDVIVDGDLIPEDSNIIKTRSRAKLMPNRYTQIPVPAKILKILVGEYTQAVDGPPSQANGKRREDGANGDEEIDGNEDEDDDDDDGWDDDEDFVKKQRHDAFLSDMLGEDLDGDLEDLIAQHDEEQYSDDAVYNMPFRSYLADFFRQLAQDSEMATQLGSYLTTQEISVLRSALS